MEELVTRLRKRAEIRRQITTRKSVQEGQPDRIADLLEEAADEIVKIKSLTKDKWIQKAKALLFDISCASSVLGLHGEVLDLIDAGGGYDPDFETQASCLRWPDDR